ncbi:hypothetical protein C8Q76DRAFT_692425 [Earliella scabrosa]|nr:hypothetical protein C8Q76DRAFT_692425 [Earliella scabrosa]
MDSGSAMPYSPTTFEASLSIAIDASASEELQGDAIVAVLRFYNDNGLIDQVALAVYQRDSPVNHYVFAAYVDHSWLVYEDSNELTRWTLDTGVVEEPTIILDFHTEEDRSQFSKLVDEGRNLANLLRSHQQLLLQDCVTSMQRDRLPEPPAYDHPPTVADEPIPDLIPERIDHPIPRMFMHELAALIAIVWASIRYMCQLM